MCELLLPKCQINKIKYYTARVAGRASDPDAPKRQQIYLRALRTLPGFEVHFGHFLVTETRMPLAGGNPANPRFVWVIKTEEKGSDVNLATHLIIDGFHDDYEQAVVVSNDSDLLEPVKFINNELRKPVGILNPHRRPSKALVRHATFIKQIRKGVLANSQFHNPLQDHRGSFAKPHGW